VIGLLALTILPQLGVSFFFF